MSVVPLSAGAVLRRSPGRFAIGKWPWRALAYVVTGALGGPLLLAALIAVAVAGVLTAPFVLGFFILRELPLLIGALAELERKRLRLLDTSVATRLHRIRTQERLTRREYLSVLRSWHLSWREVVHILIVGTMWIIDWAVLTLGPVIGVTLLISPLLVEDSSPMSMGAWTVTTVGGALIFTAAGVVWLMLWMLYLLPGYAIARGSLSKTLLDPDEDDLRSQVSRLRASRLDLVTAFATERRRIEGQLHDGVQHRLVALTMTLGLAEVQADEGPVRDLIARAHREADQALSDLRDAVRGISPQVLADRGLDAAVRELAGRTPIPVDVRLDSGGGRLHAAVEDCSYFVVAEAISNALKHSGATRIDVIGARTGDMWGLNVIDDGGGGADPSGGHGIAGLMVRCTAIGGTLEVVSPDGGPTELRMLCPLTPN